MKTIAVAALLISGSAFAYDRPHVTVGVGTQGLGLDITQPLSDTDFSITAQFNYFSKSKSFDEDDGTYDGKVKLSSNGILLNYHPFSGAFHLSGGVYQNNNRFNGSFESDDPAEPTENVHVDFKKFAPYAGLGWQWHPGIAISLDAGVMFQGSARVDVTSTCSLAACAVEAQNQEDDLRDDVEDYKYYPVVRFGIGF